MAGANAVGVGTAIFSSPTAPLKIVEGINEWLDSHGVTSVSEIVGVVK